MTEYKNTSKYLKEKRIEAGLTQAELGDKLKDVHSQFVSNWERGMCGPPNHCLGDLIKYLKLDKQKLVDVMLLDAEAGISAKVYPRKRRTS